MATQKQAPYGADRSEHEAARQGGQTAARETYPGPRQSCDGSGKTSDPDTSAGDSAVNSPATNGNAEPGNETGLNADTPAAGDVDPDFTRSAEETGQDGDPTECKKSVAHPWNG